MDKLKHWLCLCYERHVATDLNHRVCRHKIKAVWEYHVVDIVHLSTFKQV